METGSQKLVIEGLDKVSIVAHRDILYCKADGNYSMVLTKDNEQYILCKRIGILEGELNNSNFIRISQSLLVNKNYMKHIYKKNKTIVLIDEQKLSYRINTKSLISLLIPEVIKDDSIL